MSYRFTEHKNGYRTGKTLVPWRPQYAPIISLIPAGSSVLDVGCGDGALGIRLIREKNCRVWGFDLDRTGAAEARRKGVQTRVWDADTPFPYRKLQFDVVVCNELLEFCDRPDFVISECLRVGKRAIIEFPNFGFVIYRLELMLGSFPRLALYGHRWWNTRQTKFFTYKDVVNLPIMKKATINRVIGINWKNRRVSFLASLLPNFFARSVILDIMSI